MKNMFLIAWAVFRIGTAGYGDVAVPAADDGGWTFSTSGKFEGWVDARALLVLYHPWEESASGTEAVARRDLRLPNDWTGPARLHFYMTDDYDGQADLFDEDWRGRISLPGHRFKQVWVNDSLLWERDVADEEGTAEPSRFSVLLPDTAGPGDTLHLAVKLVDKAGSGERLEGDARVVAPIDNIPQDGPWKFMTHLYAGDFTITSAETESIPPGERPSSGALRTRHAEKAFPVIPSSSVSFPVTLHVQGGKAEGFSRALRCGVPLPPGKAAAADHVRLRAMDGHELPAACAAIDHWPDGSVRWTEIATVLDGTQDQLLLDVADAPPAPSPPGPKPHFTAGEGIDGVLLQDLSLGTLAIPGLSASVAAEGKTWHPLPAKETVESNPLYAEIRIEGRLAAGEDTLGRYECVLTAFHGMPYARMTWRVFSERPGQTKIERMAVDIAVPIQDRSQVSWNHDGGLLPEPLSVHQDAEEHVSVNGSGGTLAAEAAQGEGWLGVTDGQRSACALLRHFAEQHPTEIAYAEGAFHLALFSPTEDEPFYAPHEGEAKRHEIWFGLWDQPLNPLQFSAIAAYFADPPHMMNPDYFCASGALGRAYPHDGTRFTELTDFMEKTYSALPESAFYATGIRHWGDLIYDADKQHWRNGYYDRPQGFAVEYFMTGDYRWFRRLEAASRHILDVDLCRVSAEHPDWIGGIHAYYGPDHSTEAPWNPCQRIKGLLAYARLTADKDLFKDALAVARSAAGEARAVGAVSVRDHAGVLDALVAGYDATRDLRPPGRGPPSRPRCHD